MVIGLQAQNVQTVILALSIVNWMITARLVRGEVVSLKRQDYVRSAQALGAGRRAVPRRHIVPNAFGIILVAVFLELPAVVLGEAFLSVLGLGPEAPTPTWGNMALEGITFGRLWLVFLPSRDRRLRRGANLLADGVGDAIDPRRWGATGPPQVAAAGPDAGAGDLAGSPVELLAPRGIRDDADVDPRERPDEPHDEGALDDLLPPPAVGRSEQDVGRPAIGGDRADGRDEVL